MLDKGALVTTLNDLVTKYEKYRTGVLHEALTRYAFIDPLLISLGWDTSDIEQCIVEDRVPKAEGIDRTDYTLLNVDGRPRVIWEAKRADEEFALQDIRDPSGIWKDLRTKRYLEQALEYGYRKGADWVVLTNGHQLVLMESFRRGREHLRVDQTRLVFRSLVEMLERADELWILNRSAVLTGKLDQEYGLAPLEIIVSQPLPQVYSAPDIYSAAPDWMNTPIIDIPNREVLLCTAEPEEVHSNLYPVVELPEQIHFAPTSYRDRSEVFRQVGASAYVPCVLREKCLWTFADLQRTLYLNEGVCTKHIQTQPTSSWLENQDKCRWLIDLLNDCLNEHIYQGKLRLKRYHDRYYFLPQSPTIFRRADYYSYTKRGSRWVVKQDQETGYWIHYAASVRFTTIGKGIFLLIDPTYVITQDGYHHEDPHVTGPMITSLLSDISNRNSGYHYKVNFWKSWLAQETQEKKPFLILQCGNATVKISTSCLSGTAAFGVPIFEQDQDGVSDAGDEEE